MRSRGPPSASSTVRREAPKPLSARSFASAAGPSPSEVSARMRAPGCKCGRTRSSVRPCSDSSTVCGSDQPSRAAARLKGRRRRHDDHLARIDVPRQHRADAVMERIARGEHADRPAAMAHDFFGRAVERARPRPRRAANERRRERRDAAGRRTRFRPRRSARAPPGSSPRRRPRRCRRWTASAAMRQCRARSGSGFGMPRILILGGTTEAPACWANASPSAAIST